MAKTKTTMARCPECDARIDFKNMPELEQLITCSECGELLEVVDRNPLTLYWAYDFEEESEEDFDDDEEFDDDDDWQ